MQDEASCICVIYVSQKKWLCVFQTSIEHTVSMQVVKVNLAFGVETIA